MTFTNFLLAIIAVGFSISHAYHHEVLSDNNGLRSGRKMEVDSCVSTKIKCAVDSTGKSCESMAQSLGCDEDVTYTFKYCNLSDDVMTPRSSSEFRIDGEPVKLSDYSSLEKNECRTQRKSVSVDTCNPVIAQFKVQGPTRSGDWCYDFSFFEAYPFPEMNEYTRTEIKTDTLECNLDANVYCHLNDGSGSECNDVAKGTEATGCDTPVKLSYEICNAGSGIATLTNIIARYDQNIVDMDAYQGEALSFNRCISHEEFAVVNTCVSDFWADIKVSGPHDTSGWCYEYKFVETVPGARNTSPAISPTTSMKLPKGTNPQGTKTEKTKGGTSSKTTKAASMLSSKGIPRSHSHQ